MNIKNTFAVLAFFAAGAAAQLRPADPAVGHPAPPAKLSARDQKKVSNILALIRHAMEMESKRLSKPTLQNLDLARREETITKEEYRQETLQTKSLHKLPVLIEVISNNESHPSTVLEPKGDLTPANVFAVIGQELVQPLYSPGETFSVRIGSRVHQVLEVKCKKQSSTGSSCAAPKLVITWGDYVSLRHLVPGNS